MTIRWPRRCSRDIPGSGVPNVLRMDERLHLREADEQRPDLRADVGEDALDRAVGVDDDEPVDRRQAVVLPLQAALEPFIALLDVLGEAEVHSRLVVADLLAGGDL